MIQRIQSVYLLIVILGNILAIFFLASHLNDILNLIAEFDFEYHAFFGVITLLSIMGLLMYKNRGSQMRVGVVNLLLNFVALGFLVYWLLTLPGEMDVSEKGIGLVLPVISIVFIVLAQKAIKRDDELVKSANRFR